MRSLRKEIIADIYLGENGRQVTQVAVADLARSMARVGLLNPIVIRYVTGQEVTMPDGEIVESAPHLIYGRHRLAAAKLLGWQEIDCEVLDVDSRRARMLEIAENLHRAELTVLERGEQTAEWLRLVAEEEAEAETLVLSAQLAPKIAKDGSGRGRPESGISAASRELGIERTEAQRAAKIDKLAPEAKAEAKVLRLDDNQSALLKAARQPSKEEQLRALREHAAQRQQSRAQAPARDPLNDFETVERQVDALMAAWNRAGPEAREIFLGRIENPIADNTSTLRVMS